MRICTEADLGLLRERYPTPADIAGSHYAEQCAGNATFLVGWQVDEPLGWAVLLDHCVGENAQSAFPRCVEIIHLQVREEYRSRGVGTAIIKAAEKQASDAGREQIGLGVDLTNRAATRLYRRLNYRPTGILDTIAYRWCDEQGTWHDAEETSELLIKQL